MCCVLSVIMLIGPRAGIILWWLLNPLRFSAVFNSFLWPVLGTLFMPFTTLAFLLLKKPFFGGLVGLDWLLIAIAVIADLSSYGGGFYSQRNRG